MRSPVLTPLFIAAALFGENIASSAQSAGSYPWCAINWAMDSTGTPQCYFDTRQQCMESVSGIGGLCVANQYYHGTAGQPVRRAHVAKVRKHATALQ